MTFAFDLDLLGTFVAVVETGGFTRAAERINLTQSTVSQQIKKLETNVGHTLLSRDKSGSGVEPTEQGELLLSYARRILSISEEAAETMRRPTAPKTVRLGVPEDFAGRRLIDLLSRFSMATPHIRLDTVSGWSAQLNRLLELGEIDLALVKREPGEGTAIARWPEDLVWVAGAGHTVPTDPVPLAVFPPGCIYRERAIRLCESQGRPWRIAYTSQGLMGVQAAVASGLGISLLPANAVLPEHRRLGKDDGFAPEAPSELALVKSKSRLTSEVRILGDFLATNLDTAGDVS